MGGAGDDDQNDPAAARENLPMLLKASKKLPFQDLADRNNNNNNNNNNSSQSRNAAAAAAAQPLQQQRNGINHHALPRPAPADVGTAASRNYGSVVLQQHQLSEQSNADYGSPDLDPRDSLLQSFRGNTNGSQSSMKSSRRFLAVRNSERSFLSQGAATASYMEQRRRRKFNNLKASASVLVLSIVLICGYWSITLIGEQRERSESIATTATSHRTQAVARPSQQQQSLRLASLSYHMTATGAAGNDRYTKKQIKQEQQMLRGIHATQAVAGLQLRDGFPPPSVQYEYDRLARLVDWDAVERDVAALLTDPSRADYWPADYGNYGGLFVRLSWHSCGSYRASDGRGGCDGGGQRFDPERSWPDNTNLDKARKLLEPIKAKYGNGLSWGDLFALAGTAAIRAMGGPTLGFCAGRIDLVDNRQTLPLGPSPQQEEFQPCEVDGQCPYPLGQNTLGLVYVNPEGPMGIPDPVGAAETIRDVFGRMDWTHAELVALIGGGHTFGKAHGASTADNGVPPSKCPFAPWDGPKGVDAITSGFEGPWTSTPTQWDNKYFQYLVDFEWEPVVGPGGRTQWRVKGGNGPKAPSANPHSNETQDVMMLTTDIALKADPEYREWVQAFAANQTLLEEYFAAAWYTLVTRDMGPASRCIGPKTPEPQPFQNPLPPPPSPKHMADMEKVASDLHRLMENHNGRQDDEFLRLAYQCACTFRTTDYLGGCNGARIRFSPGKDWEPNAGLDKVFEMLEPVKSKYGDGLSWADLIVLSGNVAAERAGVPKKELKFCPGRTDAEDGRGWKHLSYGNDRYPESVLKMIELYQRRGQSAQEFVALTFAKYKSSETLESMLLAPGRGDTVLEEGLKYYPELRQFADYYAAVGTNEYASDFAYAWTRLMNADRFDGPVKNVCPV